MFATKPTALRPSQPKLDVPEHLIEKLVIPTKGTTNPDDNQIKQIIALINKEIKQIRALINKEEGVALCDNELEFIFDVYRDWLLSKVSEESYNFHLAVALSVDVNNYKRATEEEIKLTNNVFSILSDLCKSRKLDAVHKEMLRLAFVEVKQHQLPANVLEIEEQSEPKVHETKCSEEPVTHETKWSEVNKEEEAELNTVAISQEPQVNNGAIVDLLTTVLAKIDALNEKVEAINNKVETLNNKVVIQTNAVIESSSRAEKFEESIISEVRGQTEYINDLLIDINKLALKIPQVNKTEPNLVAATLLTPVKTQIEEDNMETIRSPFTGKLVVRPRLEYTQSTVVPAREPNVDPEPEAAAVIETFNNDDPIEEESVVKTVASVKAISNVAPAAIVGDIVDASEEQPKAVIIESAEVDETQVNEELATHEAQCSELASQLAKLGKQYPNKIPALFRRLKGIYGEAVTKAAIIKAELDSDAGWTDAKVKAYQSAIDSVFPGWLDSLSNETSEETASDIDDTIPGSDISTVEPTPLPEPIINEAAAAPVEEKCIEPVNNTNESSKLSSYHISDEALDRLSMGFGKAIKFETFDQGHIFVLGRESAETHRLNKGKSDDYGIDWWAVATHTDNITHPLLDVIREYIPKGLGETESYLLSLAAYAPTELADRLQAIAIQQHDENGKRLDYTPKLARFRQIEAAVTKLVNLLTERRFVEAIEALYGWSKEHTQQFLSEANDIVTNKGRYQFFVKMEAVFTHVKAHKQ